MRQGNFGKWYIFIKALENGFSQLSLFSSKAYRCSWKLYDDPNQVKVYFGVKTFPVGDMKRCYLQKKICATIRDFRKAFTQQTHHVDSTLKRRGNGRFYVVSTWNPRGVFVGQWLLYDIHELHFSISIYEINTSISVFKWLVVWKRGLP